MSQGERVVAVRAAVVPCADSCRGTIERCGRQHVHGVD